MIVSNLTQGVAMYETLQCGHYPDWVHDRGLENEEWVHDKWDD